MPMPPLPGPSPSPTPLPTGAVLAASDRLAAWNADVKAANEDHMTDNITYNDLLVFMDGIKELLTCQEET